MSKHWYIVDRYLRDAGITDAHIEALSQELEEMYTTFLDRHADNPMLATAAISFHTAGLLCALKEIRAIPREYANALAESMSASVSESIPDHPAPSTKQ